MMNRTTADFVENQSRAIWRSSVLGVLFLLATVATAAAIAVMASLVAEYLGTKGDFAPWSPKLLLASGGSAALVILISSLVKAVEMWQGGEAVARLLGAVPVPPNTNDPGERRLLNVVEEMAIASGVPIPQLYVLRKDSTINAFAAGFSPRNSVIGVTDGALRRLTRDELQGVIAHEFSHILNGDVRLNLRLIAVVYGLLSLSLLGARILVETFRSVDAARSRSGDREKGGGILLLVGIGAAIWFVGLVGYWLGTVIKLAISRQREFLADASAVQFTRNPEGLAGALMKLGEAGSRVSETNAEQVSHMFFGEGVVGLGRVSGLGSHPPLADRIRAIKPDWDGKFRPAPLIDEVAPPGASARVQETFQRQMSPVSRAVLGLAPETMVGRAGTLAPEDIRHAAALLESIPEELRAATRDPRIAPAVLFATLLSRNAEVRERQRLIFERRLPPVLHQWVTHLESLLGPLGGQARLPLVELCYPVLRTEPLAALEATRAVAEELCQADGTTTPFEMCLMAHIREALRAHGTSQDASAKGAVGYTGAAAQVWKISIVLSLVAWNGREEKEALVAFAHGAETLGHLGQKMQLLRRKAIGLDEFSEAAAALRQADPQTRFRAITACAHAAASDGVIALEEAELLRAMSLLMDVPLPPLARREQAD